MPHLRTIEESMCHYGQESEFDVKYHILHDFRTSTPFKEKSSNHFKDLHEMSI